MQALWGIACYLYSPHHILLSLVSGALILYTVASMLVEDEEILIMRFYLMIWIVPATYLALASLSTLMGFYTAAGIKSADLPLQGGPHEYIAALKNYFIAQLIPPVFATVRWIEARFP